MLQRLCEQLRPSEDWKKKKSTNPLFKNIYSYVSMMTEIQFFSESYSVNNMVDILEN